MSAVGTSGFLPPALCSLSPPAARLALQPQRRSASAVVEGGVGRIVLHIWLPGTSDRVGIGIDIVLLCCHIPLNIENKLPAYFQVAGTPLFLEHGRELGIIDMAAVARLVGGIHAVEHAIRFPGNTQRPHGQALELAQIRGSHISTILLELHLCLNAYIFEIALR